MTLANRRDSLGLLPRGPLNTKGQCFPLTGGMFPGSPVTLPLLVLLAGPFGTLDPFASGSFNSAEGFADFSQMSKVKHSPLPPNNPYTSASVFMSLIVVLSWASRHNC